MPRVVGTKSGWSRARCLRSLRGIIRCPSGPPRFGTEVGRLATGAFTGRWEEDLQVRLHPEIEPERCGGQCEEYPQGCRCGDAERHLDRRSEDERDNER